MSKLKNVLLIVLLSPVLVVGDPGWGEPNQAINTSITFLTAPSINGILPENEKDKVGAFVQGELRGEADVIINGGKSYSLFGVRFKALGEEVTFKFYDSSEDVIIESAVTHVISGGDVNNGVGSADNPFVLDFTDREKATITIENLTHTYDGSPKSPNVTTNPSGLDHTITYHDSNNKELSEVPKDAGVYLITVKINDKNYQGLKTEMLTIKPVPVPLVE